MTVNRKEFFAKKNLWSDLWELWVYAEHSQREGTAR